MNIGLDAKRAYHNGTGLGFFSRVLVQLMATHFPQHVYYLFNPKPGKLFEPQMANTIEVLPQTKLHKTFSGVWRSKWVARDFQRLKIDLYHGLSQEIPIGLSKTGIASVVTIHDLFPELYPQDFKPIDVKIYRSKLRYACKYANKIMAISEETKRHIVEKYGTDPSKIDVAYQSCDPIFSVLQSEDQKEKIRKKYALPQAFFLHVGTIIERKNLLNICKALQLISKEIDIPLVVVGKGGTYKEKVKQYLANNNLSTRVIFLSDELALRGQDPFVATEDLPGLYQLATAMIYPSFYEGFGIPIVEAMSSGIPVITSTTSCLPEIAGNAAFLANPASPVELAKGLKKMYGDVDYRTVCIKKGFENAQRFAPGKFAQTVMTIYNSAL